jgi:transposase
MKRPIGIDISCKTLDYYLLNQAEQIENGIYQNTQIDITSFLNKYPAESFYLVIEPTGTYGDKLVEIAHNQGFEICLANPKKSSKFMEVLDLLHKTDANAAMALCLMGQSKEIDLPRFIPQSDLLKQRKQLQITLNGLQKQHNMISNQIHAMEQRLKPSELSLSALMAIKTALEEQIKLLEKELQQLGDDEIKEFNLYAQSVVGIGPKSSNLLMLYTNGLKYFEKKTQLSKFTGIVPTSHKSGTSINVRGRITKNGPSLLRACLYNAAKSAKKHNHACKALYHRLRTNGKSHKVAMIAVINKLLHQVFAVVKNKTLFDNERYLNQFSK